MSSRDLSTAMTAAIAAGTVRPVIFYEGSFYAAGSPDEAFLRLWSGLGTFTWDSKSWDGAGKLLSISPLEESAEIKAVGFNVTLSGLPGSVLSTALDNIRQGRPGRVWLGLMSNLPTFDAPLTHTVELEHGTGPASFTRATTATIEDHEGVIRSCLSGEVRFKGARRVQNLLTFTEDLTNVAWSTNTATVTSGVSDPAGGNTAFTLTADGVSDSDLFQGTSAALPAGRTGVQSFWARKRTGAGALRTYNSADAAVDLTLTTEWRRYSVPPVVSGGTNNMWFRLMTTGDQIDIWHPQVEDVTGQSNQAPAEYVSVGALSSPYHGAMVDGVKYFDTENGNSVVSNVVVEAEGAAIDEDTLEGYLPEYAHTNLVLNSLLDGTDFSTQSVNVTAQTYTLSFYGTGTITLSGASSAGPLVGTGVYPQRVTLTFTPSAGSLTLTVSGSCKYAQLVAGSLPGSFIPTAGAAVTRNADVLTYPSAGNVVDAAGTIAADFRLNTVIDSVVRYAIGDGAGAVGSLVFVTFNSYAVSAADNIAGTGGVFCADGRATYAAAYADADFTGAANGVVDGSQTGLTVLFPNGIAIGHHGGGAQLNGTIKNVRAYKKHVITAQIEILTRGDELEPWLIADPYLIRAGRMDYVSVSASGDTTNITAQYEDRLVDLERSRERRYTDEDQQFEYTGDRGFEFVSALQDKQLIWGGPGAASSPVAMPVWTRVDDPKRDDPE